MKEEVEEEEEEEVEEEEEEEESAGASAGMGIRTTSPGHVGGVRNAVNDILHRPRCSHPHASPCVHALYCRHNSPNMLSAC